MFWLRVLLAWLGLLVLAVGCGVARVKFLEPRLGEQRAHVAGTLAASALLFAAIAAFVRMQGLRDPGSLLAVGVVFTGLTVAFEFLFGRFVAGHSWSRLLQDYNVAAGRIWILVLAVTLLGPLLAGRLVFGPNP